MRILIFSFAIGMSLPSMTEGAITEGALINGLWGPMPEWKRFTPAAFLEVPEEPTKDSVRDTEGGQSDGTLYKTKRAGLATYLYRKADNRNRLGYDPAAMASDTKHLLGRGNRFQATGGVMMRRSQLNDGQMFGQDYDQFKSNLN